jgi:hypothetical protein
VNGFSTIGKKRWLECVVRHYMRKQLVVYFYRGQKREVSAYEGEFLRIP